jgi:hypothetical protein
MTSFNAQPVDRSAIKPIYIIVAEDPSEPEGIAYYKSQDLNENSAFLEIRIGYLLNKTQAVKLVKDPHASINGKTEPKAINRKIPWSRIIRIDHITYNKKSQD